MDRSLPDLLWVVVASALVFTMQAGFAMVESGLTRGKNSINVAVKNLTDFGVSTIAFWALGFGLMFGPSLAGLAGGGHFLFEAPDGWMMVFFFFQAMFCSTAATIVSGAVAERMRFSSYLLSTLVLSVLIYPVFGHWAWGGAGTGTAPGWLASLGFVDFAGSTVVHSVGGWAALALLLVIGPRTGRYGADGKPVPINGSNVPMAVLGVCLLWFGWFGFNGGSTLAFTPDVATIVVNTALAGAAGMLAALFSGWRLDRRPDIGMVINGALAGLVAVTAGCHAYGAASSLLVGALGGLAMVAGTRLLDRLKIDDAVGAIPVHLFGGILGTLAVAFLGDPARLGTGLGRWEQAGAQLIGIAACGAWVLPIAWLAARLLNRLRPIRVSAEDEHIGLNKAEHGVSTEILDLHGALAAQAASGDISQRAPVEPFTEAGQIASMYNAVLDRLESNTVAKDEYIQIMTNVGDGMFLLDRSGRIGPYYSAALERLFGSSDLAGRELATVCSAFLQPETLASLGDFLAVCFDPAVAWRHAERLNPLADVAASRDDGHGGFDERRLQFHFRRIGGETPDRLLVLVRDHTAEVRLAEEVERTREQGEREMELLYRVLHVPAPALSDFLTETARDLGAVNAAFRDTDPDLRSRLNRIFRLTHAIKGNAALLELDIVGAKAEAMEDQVRALLAKPEAGGEDFLGLTLLYSDLNSSVDALRGLVERLTAFGAHRAQAAADPLEGLAARLAAREGKPVRFALRGAALADLPPEARPAVRACLVQMLRNAIRHGIEPADERRARGKPAAGRIEAVLTQGADGSWSLRFADDGGGIDLERVRSRALERGLVAAGEADAAGASLVSLIFHPGFSTADHADEVAGKGIGMSLVRERVKELGGRIGINTKPGKGTEFRISWPAAEARP